jgi:hypothetical protein
MGDHHRELARHSDSAQWLAELHRAIRRPTIRWRRYFRFWLETYFDDAVPFRTAWRFMPWIVRIAQSCDRIRALPFHQVLVVSWIGAVFKRFIEARQARERSADAYQLALHHIGLASAALARAQRETYLWTGVNEQVRSASDVLDGARSTLIQTAGDAVPVLHREMSLLSFGRLDILDWVLFRVFVDRAGMSRRQAYAVIAEFEGLLFREHVEPVSIRKRLSRLRTSPALIFAAPWEMLLFECLGVETTRGLLQGDPRVAEQIFENMTAMEVHSEDDYVRGIRVIRDLETIRRSVSAVYDPFLRQIEDVMERMECISADGRRLEGQAEIDGDTPENRARLAELLSQWAAWMDTAASFQKALPDIARRLAAMYRLMGTDIVVEPL